MEEACGQINDDVEFQSLLIYSGRADPTLQLWIQSLTTSVPGSKGQ